MSVDEAQDKISSTGFVAWCVYLEQVEWEDRSKLEYYLAQVAAVVCRGYAKNPKTIKVEQFLLDFKAPSNAPKTVEERTFVSKQFWLRILKTKKTSSNKE